MAFGFKIIVEGDYACFTRPEMKVERVSYDIPTPGAIEGLLKSVYWKPAIRYVVDRIIIFNPIRFTTIRTNEIKNKLLESSVKKQMRDKNVDICLYADEERTQRASTILKDVKYGIEFHFEMTGLKSDKEDDKPEKHYNIIKRRLEKGSYYRTPCLGITEYVAKQICLVDEINIDEISDEFQDKDIDLGYMLYKMEFEDHGIPINNNWEDPKFSDKATAVFYRPHIVNGIVDVEKYREMRAC